MHWCKINNHDLMLNLFPFCCLWRHYKRDLLHNCCINVADYGGILKLTWNKWVFKNKFGAHKCGACGRPYSLVLDRSHSELAKMLYSLLFQKHVCTPRLFFWLSIPWLVFKMGEYAEYLISCERFGYPSPGEIYYCWLNSNIYFAT